MPVAKLLRRRALDQVNQELARETDYPASHKDYNSPFQAKGTEYDPMKTGHESATVRELVEEASEAVGIENTAGGECGAYALALAQWLEENGHACTIGIWSDAHRNVRPEDVLTNSRLSIEHVCVECEGKLWDGEGETNTDRVLFRLEDDRLMDEDSYPVRTSYFGGYDPNNPKLRQAIRIKTAPMLSVGDFYAEIAGGQESKAKRADIKMHKSPKLLPPRHDQRSLLDDDVKKEMENDPDLKMSSHRPSRITR